MEAVTTALRLVGRGVLAYLQTGRGGGGMSGGTPLVVRRSRASVVNEKTKGAEKGEQRSLE